MADTWRVAYALDTLLHEIDAEFPDRSKISDGAIGDPAHATRVSDHNPWIIKDGVGIVRARDFTHDPEGGLDARKLAPRLVQLMKAGHPALKSGSYIIWNGRIISYDRLDEGWRTYTGDNKHDKHLHLSVTTNRTGYDSKKPWNVVGPKKNLTPYITAVLAARTIETRTAALNNLLASEAGARNKATAAKWLDALQAKQEAQARIDAAKEALKKAEVR